MNNDKEQFSAWLDDAEASEPVACISSSDEPGAMGMAARYRLIGDALRGEIEDNSLSDISAVVRNAIEAEPAHHVTVKTAHVKRQRRVPLFDIGSWLRPVGGLALAASVAMIVVVTVTREETPSGADAFVATSAPPPALSVPVSHQPKEAVPARSYAANQTPAGPAINLNKYMEEHSEYASQDTMQGMMPYARAVSYESK